MLELATAGARARRADVHARYVRYVVDAVRAAVAEAGGDPSSVGALEASAHNLLRARDDFDRGRVAGRTVTLWTYDFAVLGDASCWR